MVASNNALVTSSVLMFAQVGEQGGPLRNVGPQRSDCGGESLEQARGPAPGSNLAPQRGADRPCADLPRLPGALAPPRRAPARLRAPRGTRPRARLGHAAAPLRRRTAASAGGAPGGVAGATLRGAAQGLGGAAAEGGHWHPTALAWLAGPQAGQPGAAGPGSNAAPAVVAQLEALAHAPGQATGAVLVAARASKAEPGSTEHPSSHARLFGNKAGLRRLSHVGVSIGVNGESPSRIPTTCLIIRDCMQAENHS